MKRICFHCRLGEMNVFILLGEMNVFILFGEMNIFILLGEINIDYYMTFFISYSLSAREPIGSRDDI